MLKIALLGFAALALVAVAAHAAEAPSMPNVQFEAGLQAYKTSGPEAALRKWLEGGPLEGSKEAINQANMLRAVEGVYGSYTSYHMVREVEVSPTTRFHYAVMNYEQGPLFCSFTLFKSDKGWKIVNFRFHTEPWQVWPEGLLAHP